MTKPLVIVESPTKVRTIKKYLGKDYNIAATVGHIRDLPEKKMGIDIEAGFKPEYKNIPGKQKVISELRKAAGDAKEIYLAPDPDREGEAIACHAADVLKKQGRVFHRVLFHELTKSAIMRAISAPEAINKEKYQAQQARRILDRIVGYQISPLLWRKVKGGLSAGRVQSVALRIICEREEAIQAFISEEYWSVTAHLEADSPPVFTAKLAKKSGKKIKIPDKESVSSILEILKKEKFIVNKIKKRTTKRNPLPPFTTSKLQQEAIRKLRFSAKKTMTVAQQLYEGVDLGPGKPEGLITYMRTDSTRIAGEAAIEALELIREQFGKEFAPGKPRFFRNKKKVQDAHEAIRPTSVYNTPEKLARFLSKDQLELYRLIWQRFVASQMTQALIDQVSISILAGKFEFTATGSSIKFAGFMVLYLSVEEQAKVDSEKKQDLLPGLSEGMELAVKKIDPKQHFTIPPPRFSEASLVKELEENGIGRPSTYAAILSTIRGKGYVDLVKGYFRPGELGFIVNHLLVENFSDVFNVNFTARMEDNLDRVETADVELLSLLSDFYGPFKKELDVATEKMLSMRGVGIATDLTCPGCNRGILHIKVGRNGEYLGCDKYPDCTYTRNYTRDEKGKLVPIELPKAEASDKVCEKCGKPMVVKHGQFGAFLACSGYPDCKKTESLSGGGPQSTGVKCPEKNCGGEIMERKSKRGKIFFGCNNYPKCTFATWDKPAETSCPDCGAVFLVEKTSKKYGHFLACLTKGCGYKLIL